MEDAGLAELREVIDEAAAVVSGHEAGIVLYALSFLIGKIIATGPLNNADRARSIRMACELIDDVANNRHHKTRH